VLQLIPCCLCSTVATSCSNLPCTQAEHKRELWCQIIVCTLEGSTFRSARGLVLMGKSMQHVLGTLLFVMNRACSMQHFSNFAKTLRETLRFNFVHSPVHAQHLSGQCYINRFRIRPDLQSSALAYFRRRQRSARPAGLRSNAELCAASSSAGSQSSALESRASEPALPGLQGSAQHSSARSKPLQGFPVPRSLG